MTSIHRAVGCFGVRASVCPADGDDGNIFVLGCDLPAGSFPKSFVYEDQCYTIDPYGTCEALPSGFTVVDPAGLYDSCGECIEDDHPGDMPTTCGCTALQWVAMCEGGDSCGGLVPAYEIAGYTLAYFAHSSCSGPTGGLEWNGRFACAVDTVCHWPLDVTDFGTHHVTESELTVTPGLGIQRRTIGGVDEWSLAIYSNSSPASDFWVGKKLTGSTPAGTYTKAAGCENSKATIVAQAYVP